MTSHSPTPATLPSGPAVAVPAILRGKDDWTHVMPKPPLRLPRTQRELFELLAIHDPEEELSAFVARLDCAGLGPADIHRMVFGAAPSDMRLALPQPDGDMHALLCEKLLSDGFRARLLGGFLAAFAEKRRDVFIHVPKTAGTDLTLNLWPRRVSFPLSIATVGSNRQALGYCARLARLMPATDAIFVHGHLELGRYLAAAGVRPGDRFFTTVREPVDLLISQVSDLLGQMLRDPEAAEAQTRTWLRLMQLDRVPTGLSPAQLKDLWVAALINPKIAEPNNICRFLSEPGTATYERAMSNVVALDVEITTTAQYPQWLAERWGIASRTRHNASRRMLDRDEVARTYGQAIRGQMAEDEKFFAVVDWALRKKGEVSITGLEIAELVGSGLLTGFADELLSQRDASPHAMPAAAPEPARLVAHNVVGQPSGVGKFWPGSEAPAFAMTFGRDGDAHAYQDAGWAKPELGYTWTNAAQSLLRIPRPSHPGTYRLRARAAPFVAGERLAAQRVALTVNGIACGEVRLSRAAVLDCRIDWDLLSRADPVRLTFAMPDAAQPSEVTGHPNDTRLLGLSFQRLWLVGPVADGLVAADGAAAARPQSAPPAPASVGELMLRFESLGENCEFGLVQRRGGVDPLGLFRFASAPLPLLMNALAARFAGFGKPEHLKVEVSANGREYMVFEKQYQFRYHAWVGVQEKSADEVLAREARRLPFLVRKLLADLAEGSKIFVYHGMQPVTQAAAADLARAVRSFGAGTLLWVEQADAAHPPGSVLRLGDGLLKGHMDRFAPGDNAHDISMPCWVRLCEATVQAMA